MPRNNSIVSMRFMIRRYQKFTCPGVPVGRFAGVGELERPWQQAFLRMEPNEGIVTRKPVWSLHLVLWDLLFLKLIKTRTCSMNNLYRNEITKYYNTLKLRFA